MLIRVFGKYHWHLNQLNSLTIFITPFGRYQFHRLLFGITSASEHFQQCVSEILSGMKGTVSMMDDVLIFGTDQEEHDKNLAEALMRIERVGLTLNKEKCEFSKDHISFLGQTIDSTGVHLDLDKVSPIKMVPTPCSITELHRFLGMTNQLIWLTKLNSSESFYTKIASGPGIIHSRKHLIQSKNYYKLSLL